MELIVWKKKSDIEKAHKQATTAVQKQRTSVASQASLDSMNSQEACTSGQPRQSKPASKETKSHQRSASPQEGRTTSHPDQQ